MKEYIDQINVMIKKLRALDNKKIAIKLDLNKCERLVDKFAALSKVCQECEQKLKEFRDHLMNISEKVNQLDKSHLKQHTQHIQQIYSHFQKKHKLLPEGYYMGIYMSIGMSLGVVFGLTIFDNIALGIPIGMCLGIAIGAGLDADVKKKGNTI